MQLRFGLGGAFADVRGLLGAADGGAETTSTSALILTAATLNLFSLTGTVSGGLVSRIPSDWDEESAVWDDYVSRGWGGASLLPAAEDLLDELGPVESDYWYSSDLTGGVAGMFYGTDGSAALALRIGTRSSDGVIYESKEHGDGRGPFLELTFALVTTTAAVGEAEGEIAGDDAAAGSPPGAPAAAPAGRARASSGRRPLRTPPGWRLM